MDKRQLRLRIGRMRRQIDRHIVAADRSGRKLLSWRTYAQRYPGYAALAAFGTGLALSVGLKRGRLQWWLGGQLVREVAGRIAGQIGEELRRWWGEAFCRSPKTDTANAAAGSSTTNRSDDARG
jgi:hypothetical protein